MVANKGVTAIDKATVVNNVRQTDLLINPILSANPNTTNANSPACAFSNPVC